MSSKQVGSITNTYSLVFFARSSNDSMYEIHVGSWLDTGDEIEVFYTSKEHSDEYTLDYLEIGNTRVPLKDVNGKGVKFKGTLPSINAYGKVDVIVHDKLIGVDSSSDTPKVRISSLDLTNCSTNYKVDDEINVGDTIEITPDSGYEFTKDGTATSYNDFGVSIEKPIDKSTGSYKVPDDISTLAIKMSATKKDDTPKVRISSLHLTNCSASVNGSIINVEDKIDAGSTITVKANDNFIFTSNGTATLTNSYGVSSTSHIVVDSSDKTLATIKLDSDVTTVGLEMNAIENTPVPETSGGFINTYVVNNDILNELSKNRFTYKDSGTGGATPVTTIDHATMISSLLNIPYSVKSITGAKNDIVLGNLNTKVLAPRLTDNVLHVKLGTIIVGELNKDNSDYQNTDCELYVPYSKPIKLDSENIINNSIHIMYVIDVYSGSGKIVISDNDSIVETHDVNVGSEIPFVQSTNNSHVSNLKMSISNTITRPYIRVKYYNRLDNTYDSNRLLLLSDLKGFTQINNILKIDSDNIDSDSFDKIKNELSTGIII